MCYNSPMTPPPYGFQQPVSGGTFTVTLTLQSTATATAGPNGTNSNGMSFLGSGICSAGVGPVAIGIHAQPYGWYDAGYDADLTGGKDNSGGPKIDDVTGSLTFRYKWYSTDGNIKSLSANTLHVYEHVDYTGNPGQFLVDNGIAVYRPPSPPIGLDLSHESPQAFEIGNPEIKIVDATIGATYDGHSAWPTQSPASNLPVIAPQLYEFNDDATGEVSVILYDCGSINEGVRLSPDVFYLRKGGYSVTKPF